jgi:hypothetical protein
MKPSIYNLPAPRYKNTVTHNNGYNNDIITTLNAQFPNAVKQAVNVKFSGNTLKEKGRAIYNYLRSEVKYKKDPEGKQLIQLPARMLRDTKTGDCKSLGLAAAAFMYANGFKNVRLRYTSYDPIDKTPTHVYAVADDEQGNEIIIDPVYKQFNQEVKYNFKKDFPMQISVLSGVNTAQQAVVRKKLNVAKRVKKGSPKYLIALNATLQKVQPGGLMFNVISNEIARVTGKTENITYSVEQLERYKQLLTARAANTPGMFLRGIINNEINAINSQNFRGTVYMKRDAAIKGVEEEIGRLRLRKLTNKIKAGVKKLSPKKVLDAAKTVALAAPRKAFLLLVRLNVRGLAKRMSKLTPDKLAKFWDKLGGKPSVLQSAVNAGKKKRPVFGASKKVKAIKGIGVILDNSNNEIGAEPVTLSTVLAAATPILLIISKLLRANGVPEETDPGTAPGQGESGNFEDVAPEGQAAGEKIADFVGKAVDIAQRTGIIPEKPETNAETQVNRLAPGNDSETDPTGPDAGKTGLQLNPMLLIGGAALVGLALYSARKGKK